jgi:flagellin-like hook-associated protein FlgL
MNIRPTQASNYSLVRDGLGFNLLKLVRAQEQLSSGKRILRPSDDASGTSTALSLRRQRGDIERFKAAVASSKPVMDASLSALGSAGQSVAQARELVIQGLNGTLGDNDRATLARAIEQIKGELMETANASFDGQHLFAGTSTDSAAFSSTDAHGLTKVSYQGNASARSVSIGRGADLDVFVSGERIFGKFEPGGVQFVGSTGVAAGQSANEGTGYQYLAVRHDATSATLGAGVALANGGADDTLLGDRALVIDAAAGTVRLGNGAAVSLPAITDPGAADFVVRDEHGAEVHLDFTGFTGVDFTGTISGAGSISLDGTTFTAIDFNADDIELTDAATGATVHVDGRGIVQEGTDLVTFSGAVNVFDVLQGIVDDLDNIHGLDADALNARLSSRLGELDRNHENIQSGLGALAARGQRLTDADTRLADVDLHLESMLADVEDADLSSVVLELTRAEQTLQVTQAAGARLLETTLLNYLR